jgi:hypothetical protein
MDNLTIGLIVFIVLLLAGLAVVLYLWLSKKCEEKKCEEKKCDLDLTKCMNAFTGPTGCNILNTRNCGPYHSLDQCRISFTGPTGCNELTLSKCRSSFTGLTGCPNLSDIKLYSNVQYTFKPTQNMTGSDICADTVNDEITVYGTVYDISGTGDNATAKIIPDAYIVSGPTTKEGGRCANMPNATLNGKWRSSRYIDSSDTILTSEAAKASRIGWLNKYWGDENSPPTYGQLNNLENVPIRNLKPWNYPN